MKFQNKIRHGLDSNKSRYKLCWSIRTRRVWKDGGRWLWSVDYDSLGLNTRQALCSGTNTIILRPKEKQSLQLITKLINWWW